MADITIPQGSVYATGESTAQAEQIDASLGTVLATINFPAEWIDSSQVAMRVTGVPRVDLEAVMVRVYAIGNTRTDNRRVRAWCFRLDGHNFYLIRLGESSTLVYDMTTGQWAEWSSPNLPVLRVNCGMNWLGMPSIALEDGHTTNILAGDDTAGLLWTLKPEQGYDEAVRETIPDWPFTRRVVGGIPMKMRETQKVGAAYVTASIGSPSLTGADITLRTSDDDGNTWTDHGTITAESGNYDQEYAWRSIGLIKAPGRIFEITDTGASVRIDGLDIR